MRVLFVEDNLDICANLAAFVDSRQWQLDFAYTGHSGLTLALQQQFDVIVLDVMLPDISGLDVCAQYRELSQYLTPIIMLTAKDQLDDKVSGFNAGADDYLVKPFAMRELAMSIESLAKRPVVKKQQSHRVGNIELFSDNFQIEVSGQCYTLRHLEYKLLWALAQAYPSKLSLSELSFQLWGDTLPDSSALRTQIYNTRKALKAASANHTISHFRPNYYALVTLELS